MIRINSPFGKTVSVLSTFALVFCMTPSMAWAKTYKDTSDWVKSKLPERKDDPVASKILSSGTMKKMQGKSGENPYAAGQSKWDVMYKGVDLMTGNFTVSATDLTFEGVPKIVPLRVAAGFEVAAKDTDPRGLKVIGADGEVGGVVADMWVDRSEMIFRYLEVTPAGGGRNVLLPYNFARIGPRRVSVRSIMGRHFGQVPVTKHPDQVTLLEEDKICAYYGGGTLYADPQRMEPLI